MQGSLFQNGMQTIGRRLRDGFGRRLTRQFAVTEIGKEYYRQCVAVLVEADAAQDAIDRIRADPQSEEWVTFPSSVLYSQVGDGAVHGEMPQRGESGKRDDVIREEFDIAIRVRFPRWKKATWS
jgi:DNA-binding transcriptional LysR family regulator